MKFQRTAAAAATAGCSCPSPSASRHHVAVCLDVCVIVLLPADVSLSASLASLQNPAQLHRGEVPRQLPSPVLGYEFDVVPSRV